MEKTGRLLRQMERGTILVGGCVLLAACSSVSSGEGAVIESVEPAQTVSDSGLIYHHTGLPTKKQRPGEKFVASLGAYTSGYAASEYGIEWSRYAEGSQVPAQVRETAHVGFKVENLSAALKGKQVILDPVEVAPGIRVAFIEFDGFPIELIEVGEEVDASWHKPIALKYHSIWQPRETPHEKDVHLEDLKMYAAQHESEYGVGWVRYYPDAPYPEVVKKLAHVVFEVEDIGAAMDGRKVIIPANNPDKGLWVGFIEDDGAPVEFIQVDRDLARQGL